MTDPGRYEDLAQDFSAQITAYKNANCEILTGVPIPPDFTNFYKQAAQQGFKPKAASIGKALLFPSSVEALGTLGEGLSSEVWWSPTHPFTSSLTGATSQALADGYTAATGKQWTQPIGFAHALFEVADRRPEPDHERGRQGIHPRRAQGDQARHDRRPARLDLPACRSRTSRRPRWSAASGARGPRSRTTSSSSATRTTRRSRRATPSFSPSL